MAYLNFAETGIAAGRSRTRSAPTSQGPSAQDISAQGFSALEWSVIALARFDRRSSLNKPGRLAIAMAALFGSEPNPTLADPRLEALRRVAVLGWRDGYAIPASELQAFEQAGFSLDQYELLQRSIGRARTQNGRKIYA